MITDLFSHKIHSSSPEWPDKLVELASIFAKFDGLPYVKDDIEKELLSISPRASVAVRDPSKFRDEISAYPSYLGLYHLVLKDDIWVLKLSETAKKFLVVEEPDVSAFMLLQLSLFQYPNGMGFSYTSMSNKIRLQANSRDRTLEFINDGIHLCPLRLICMALKADSEINGVNPLHPRVSIEEVFILANDVRINRSALPNIAAVVEVLTEARNGLIAPPPKYEKRFHILNHTDLIEVTGGWIHMREAYSPEDEKDLQMKLDAINKIDNQYNGFDNATNEYELKDVMVSGDWVDYFDGLVSLSADTVQILANDYQNITPIKIQPYAPDDEVRAVDYSKIPMRYKLKERDEYQTPQPNPKQIRELADPEVTQIKRQRSNLLHKIITQKIDEHLRNLGATPYENEHIDIFAKIPNDGTYLFEIKSISNENLLSQTRKGLSQLYEYRYRYKEEVGDDVVLCLVYPNEPNEIEWLQEYLCSDRGIAICWFDNENLRYSPQCANQMQHLLMGG